MKTKIFLAFLVPLGLWAQPVPRSYDRTKVAARRSIVNVNRGVAEIAPGTQNQEGSVAIAKSIRPEDENATLSNFTKCVADLKQSGVENPVKACTKAMKITAHTTERVANESADATKSARPIIIFRRYGGYY